MSIRCDGEFDYYCVINCFMLEKLVKESEILKDSMVLKLIDKDNSLINSFVDEKFSIEEQTEFFSLIQKSIVSAIGNVIATITCLEADSKQLFIISRRNITEFNLL